MPKLDAIYVEKPWGRTILPSFMQDAAGKRIGEVHFQGPRGDQDPLLVKYITTSERLSIQVHPDDDQARAAGLKRGKEECWYVLDCAPDAVLGIGFKRALTEDAFEAAARDGSIEELIDWKPVRPGDFFFIPAGTVHAIGANIVLVEIQQNSDITYRLYDYGRPRALHLEQGRAVSQLIPYGQSAVNASLGKQRRLLSTDFAPFQVELEHWRGGEALQLMGSDRIWFLPLSGSGFVDGLEFVPGECWLIDDQSMVTMRDAVDALVAFIPTVSKSP